MNTLLKNLAVGALVLLAIWLLFWMVVKVIVGVAAFAVVALCVGACVTFAWKSIFKKKTDN